MELDFRQILANYLSSNTIVHNQAEFEIEKLLNSNDPKIIDFLLNSLNSETNESFKQLTLIILKQLFEVKIVNENKYIYENYFHIKYLELIQALTSLNLNVGCKKMIASILNNLCTLFPDIYNADKILEFIFNSYSNNKLNNLIGNVFDNLYILFTFLKILDKSDSKYLFEKLDIYDKLISDFDQILTEFLLKVEVDIDLSFYLSFINLFFKISKHCVKFIQVNQREKLMEMSFRFLIKFLFNFRKDLLNKELFECIFLANQILIKYCCYITKINLKTIKNYSELFYVYISNSLMYSEILNIMKSSFQDYHLKSRKFTIQIIDFFKEILQLTSYDNWGDLVFLKNIFTDDQISISDYLAKDFFNKERIQALLLFIINNCLCFTEHEIEMSEDIEEFYNWYDNQSQFYDLREKAGLVCRIIYDRHRKEKDMIEIFHSIENKLFELIERNDRSNQNINLKCGLLYFFECLGLIFFDKHRDYKIWIFHILIPSIKNLDIEQFSNFTSLRILAKIIDMKYLKDFKMEIFENVYLIYMSSNNKLLKFGCLDFFFHFFDDMFTKNIKKEFLQDFISESCNLLKNVQSHDIQNKIITTTTTILEKYNEEEVERIFSMIFPHLFNLWNLQDGVRKQKNYITISVLRQNVVSLISIFIKKIGIFFDPDFQFFLFVYNVIGFSLSTKNLDSNFTYQECLRLVFLIQEEFSNILENTIDQDLFQLETFKMYLKMYDFFPIILDNVINSDDHLISQLLIIEQYLSINHTYFKEYFKTEENKIINLVKKLLTHTNILNFPIYNTLEYLLLMLYDIGQVIPLLINEHIFNFFKNFVSFSCAEQEEKFFADYLNEIVGIIQLTNRLIFIGLIKFQEFEINCLNLVQKIVILSNVRSLLNIKQKMILSNFLFNLGFIYSNNQLISSQIIELKNILIDNKSSQYLDSHNSTVDHWLFFFNKITNDSDFYQLTSLEDEIVFFWKTKFDNTNLFDVDIKEMKFNMKYRILLNDTMYRRECDFLYQQNPKIEIN